MHDKKMKMVALLVFGLYVAGAQAQSAIPATGGSAVGSGGSVNYSVGQVVYKTYNASGGSVSEGVQQPYEISEITAIEESLIGFACSVFPNPSTDYIVLRIETDELESLSFQIFDVTGKLIENHIITATETHIDMKSFIAATYILKLNRAGLELKSFKIIKNK